MDNEKELLPIVNEEGCVIGKTERGTAHNGSKILHPVVHLHVFSEDGKLFLQKRPEWKDVQPGKWDTAVGGHIDYGEDVTTAIRREMAEELGITECNLIPLGHYIYESDVEKEFINVYKTVFNKPITPDKNELDGGRFWTVNEIIENIGKQVFTPNFEHEYMKFFGK